MKKELVIVNTHGILEKELGYKTWKLAVNSVGAALNAIEVLSKRKLYKFLHENDKKGVKYAVLINGRHFLYEKPLDEKNIDTIKNSELCAKINGLKKIDIVPILEGSEWVVNVDFGNPDSVLESLSFFTLPGVHYAPEDWKPIIAGIVLIIAGIVIGYYTGNWYLAAAIIMAGVGLIAAGVINMLMKPPKEPDIVTDRSTSYLFSGPVNTINEGGPVPVGYGRLMIGSSVIAGSYEIDHFLARDKNRTT